MGEAPDDEMLAKLPLISSVAEQEGEFLRDWVGLARDRELTWARSARRSASRARPPWERFSSRPR